MADVEPPVGECADGVERNQIRKRADNSGLSRHRRILELGSNVNDETVEPCNDVLKISGADRTEALLAPRLHIGCLLPFQQCQHLLS